MNRGLDRLSDEKFDVVIVGGGILGAFLAHECSRSGLRTALLERRDFAGETTSASGKILHGGLRYLQHLEFGLVAESHREQERLAKLAPRLVRSLVFLAPSRRDRPMESLKLRGGACSWRLARWFLPSNDGFPAPDFVGLDDLPDNTREVLRPGISGSMRYYDYQIRSPERLTIALVCDARAHGAVVANYVEVSEFDIMGSRVKGVTALDHLAGDSYHVRGRVVVNAAGPAGARLAASVDGSLFATGFAKGAHVILDAPEPPTALALPISGQTTPSTVGDDRRLFVMPWEGKTLVGATYSSYEGQPLSVTPEESEIEKLLAPLHQNWPGLRLAKATPLYAYAGLYPVFDKNRLSPGTFSASLRPRVIDHGMRDGPRGLVSAISVKLTGAWRLAEEALAVIRRELSCDPPATRAPKAPKLSRAHPTPLPSYDEANPDLISRRSLLQEMVAASVEEEMAVTVADFLFRRTWLGHFGLPDDGTLAFIAREMGRRLGWDGFDVDRQVYNVTEMYQAVGAGSLANSGNGPKRPKPPN